MKSQLLRLLDRPRSVVHSQPMPSKGVPRECRSTGVLDDWGGKVGLPSLHGGLWDGHGILLIQELGSTSVPPIAPYLYCVTSCPSQDVGHHPVAGHGRWRTSTCSLHPRSAEDASTTNRYNMLVLSLRPRCASSKAGRRGNSETQLHSWRGSSPKKKMEGWWQRPLKNPAVRPSLSSQ